ncbi:spore coat protein A [Deinococcus enclensis]|uniref:Spore coat protein A n=1 Tax=Deinococcus enclensis TaxID=1049582 RepID=A0ABT9MHX6_9DEIO|nr:spore coat protein A [Deinococcus enclensis]
MSTQSPCRRALITACLALLVPACNSVPPPSTAEITSADEARPVRLRHLSALPVPRWVNALSIPKIATATSPDAYTLTLQPGRHDFGIGGPTTPVWTYSDGTPPSYLGPTIVARYGTPVRITWVNALPTMLPFAQEEDHLPTGAQREPMAAAPFGDAVTHLHGGHISDLADGGPTQHFSPGDSRQVDYPNDQEAATLWYHDHAMGLTRLNVMAGLAGAYVLTDPYEQTLNLPTGAYDVPLVLQDRSFNADGSLQYPERWEPEFFGDVAVVNGKAFPFLDVEPRPYRLRLLNGSNARFYRLSLSRPKAGKVTLQQIGADGGLLPVMNPTGRLLIAPGERADVIVDFSAFRGQTLTVTNDAATPYSGKPDKAGGTPPLPELLQFRVRNTAPSAVSGTPPTPLRPLSEKLSLQQAVVQRDLTLNEVLDPQTGLPLRSQLGTLNPDGSAHLLSFDDPVTETPRVNTVEAWNLINNTVDVHPIHLHLVQFQVLDRRPVLRDAAGRVTGYGPALPSDPAEAGWKDTVRASPNEATRILVRFDRAGAYVWHCHILEHEDNDMMRPLQVLP